MGRAPHADEIAFVAILQATVLSVARPVRNAEVRASVIVDFAGDVVGHLDVLVGNEEPPRKKLRCAIVRQIVIWLRSVRTRPAVLA